MLHISKDAFPDHFIFLPKTGHILNMLSKAFIEWEGNEFYKKGEKNDPYNLLCCKNIDLANPLFIEQAKKFFLPALAHREKYV